MKFAFTRQELRRLFDITALRIAGLLYILLFLGLSFSIQAGYFQYLERIASGSLFSTLMILQGSLLSIWTPWLVLRFGGTARSRRPALDPSLAHFTTTFRPRFFCILSYVFLLEFLSLPVMAIIWLRGRVDFSEILSAYGELTFFLLILTLVVSLVAISVSEPVIAWMCAYLLTVILWSARLWLMGVDYGWTNTG